MRVWEYEVTYRGVDAGGWGPDPLKICRRDQSMFWHPHWKCHILSFKNCCCRPITASFTTSRMNSWTLTLHWSAYANDATILMSDQLQADSVLQSMPLLLHWASVIMAQDKTPKRGCRWPAVNNRHRWCTSWRSRGVRLPWQCAEFSWLRPPDVLRRIGLACSVMNSLQNRIAVLSVSAPKYI